MPDDCLSTEEQVELAYGLLEGQEEAIRRALELYGPRIWGALPHNLRSVLTEADILSCLFEALVKARTHAFDEKKGTLGGWLFVLTFNAATDMVRGAGRRRTAGPLNLEPAVEPRVPACVMEDKPDPAIDDLMQAVDELGSSQQTIIKADLLAGDQADNDELAEKLGVSKQTIHSYRNKAWNSLRNRLEKKGHTAATVARSNR